MQKNLAVRWAAVASTLLICLCATTSTAVVYNWTSGTVQLRATLAGTTTSVLEGPVPVEVVLGGSFVDFDPILGPNGSVVGMQLIPASSFQLNLDETVVGYDMIEVSGASLDHALGAIGAVSALGSFNIDTVMSGTIEGIGGPPPATFVSSTTSGASGTLGISGDTLTLGLFGVNLAQFQSLTNPADIIEVKADFSFVGGVPEPGTAVLLGLGLLGLSARGRQRA
jgi:hypothetical protein